MVHDRIPLFPSPQGFFHSSSVLIYDTLLIHKPSCPNILVNLHDQNGSYMCSNYESISNA